ncbi:MAG: hypothetical protein MR428_01740, partial [Mesosutterella sp.]|nr:hypothetical protein [Mesosutterella sp.]
MIPEGYAQGFAQHTLMPPGADALNLGHTFFIHRTVCALGFSRVDAESLIEIPDQFVHALICGGRILDAQNPELMGPASLQRLEQAFYPPLGL